MTLPKVVSCFSVIKSCMTLVTPWTTGCHHPPLSPGVCSNSSPLGQWCHPTISSSIAPFSSCFQSFPALGSFPVSWLFTSAGQSVGASASKSVLPMNSQRWFPSGWTGLISLLSKGLSRIFSSTESHKSIEGLKKEKC